MDGKLKGLKLNCRAAEGSLSKTFNLWPLTNLEVEAGEAKKRKNVPLGTTRVSVIIIKWDMQFYSEQPVWQKKSQTRPSLI